MSSPIFSRGTASTSSPNSPISANLPPRKLGELSPDQEAIFTEKITPALHRIWQTLVAELESEERNVQIDSFSLIGSQMVDVMLQRHNPHIDIDFLVVIGSKKNPYTVKEAFLNTLAQFNIFLKDLPFFDNFMPGTFILDGFRVDITFAWNMSCYCRSSANCFQGDMLPYLKNTGRLNRYTTSDGYEPIRSLELLTRGFFYIEPGKPAKLRDGVRGYIHTIVAGYFPEDYRIESEFLKQWLEDYKTAEARVLFLESLSKHFKRHYLQNATSSAAFLLTLRDFFSSKEFAEKNDWLSTLDLFIDSSIGKNQTKYRIELFLTNSTKIEKSRLDCRYNLSPTRYRICLPHGGSALIEAPWDEMLIFLANSPPFLTKSILESIVSNHPIPKLLSFLAKSNFGSFVVGLANQLNRFNKTQLSYLEQIMRLLHPAKTFSFGDTPFLFASHAIKAGFAPYAKEILLLNIPESPTFEEIEMICSVATDLPTWTILAKKAPQHVIEYICTLEPSGDLLEKIAKLPLPEAKWPPSWTAFIEANPHFLKLFIQSPTFGATNHIKVISRLLNHPEIVFSTWKIGCTAGCVPEEHVGLSARIRKGDLREITHFIEGVITLFEVNVELAKSWSKKLLEEAPFASLNTTLTWKLLQVCSGRPLRRSPLTEKETTNYLKMVLKAKYDLLATLSNLIKDDSLTVYHRTDLIADLFSFTKFLKPDFKAMNGGSFTQNFFNTLIAALQDPKFVSKRKEILHQLSSFSGKPIHLPTFMQEEGKPFEECLPQLLSDLKQTNETLSCFIHWLIATSQAKSTLKEAAKTLTKEQVTPESALYLLESFEDVSASVSEQALMAAAINPQQILSILEKQKSPYASIKQFESLALTVKDLKLAIKLAHQIFRLGGRNLFSTLLAKKINLDPAIIDILKDSINTGVDPYLVWTQLLPNFHSKNIPMQLQLAEICTLSSREKMMPIVQDHFKQLLIQEANPHTRLQLIKSEFLSLAEFLGSSKELLKDPNLAEKVIDRLSSSTDYPVNFKILVELFSHPLSDKLRKKVIQALALNIERVQHWTPTDFWSLLTPFLQLDLTHERIPLELWEPIFNFSLSSFERDSSGPKATETLKYLGTLITALTSSVAYSTLATRFLETAIEVTQLVHSKLISSAEIWHSIRLLPKSSPYFNEFIQRLLDTNNPKENLQILSELIQYEKEKSQKIFIKSVEELKECNFSDFWEALEPLIKIEGIRTIIPEESWAVAYEIGLGKLEPYEDKDAAAKALYLIIPMLQFSYIWSENLLLSLARILGTIISEKTKEAYQIWELLVDQGPAFMTTPEKQKEYGLQLTNILNNFSNGGTMLVFERHFFEKLTWIQTPIPSRTELLESLELLLRAPSADLPERWIKQWRLIDQVQWLASDYSRLIDFLPRIYLHNSSLGLASQFIFNFEFGKKLSISLDNEKMIHKFHQTSIELYKKHSKELLELDESKVEFPYSEDVYAFINLSRKVPEILILNEDILKIPDTDTRSHLLSRSIGLHASSLVIGQERNPIFYADLGIELFNFIKNETFFARHKTGYFSALIKELTTLFSRGDPSQLKYFLDELNSLVKSNSHLKKLSVAEKTNAVSSIADLAIKDPKLNVSVLSVFSDFITKAVKSPDWELEHGVKNVIISIFVFLSVFNKEGDAERSLDALECLEPVLDEYVFHREYFREIFALNKKRGPTVSELYKKIYHLSGLCVANNEILKTIDRAMPIPELTQRAKDIYAKVSEPLTVPFNQRSLTRGIAHHLADCFQTSQRSAVLDNLFFAEVEDPIEG